MRVVRSRNVSKYRSQEWILHYLPRQSKRPVESALLTSTTEFHVRFNLIMCVVGRGCGRVLLLIDPNGTWQVTVSE